MVPALLAVTRAVRNGIIHAMEPAGVRPGARAGGLRGNAPGSSPVCRVPRETRRSFGRSSGGINNVTGDHTIVTVEGQNPVLMLSARPSGELPAEAATKRAAGFAWNPTHRPRSGSVFSQPLGN